MNKVRFHANFKSAVETLFPFAQSFLLDKLPIKLKYLVFLNQSYDENDLREGEKLYPEDSFEESRVREFGNVEETINHLWRDGQIPEWINLTIHSYDEEFTNISLICCGRFTADDKLLYHEREGYPPFHVLGPSVPVDYKNLEKSGKFYLAWHGRKPDKNEPYW